MANAVMVTKRMSVAERNEWAISRIDYYASLKQKRRTRAVGSSFKTYNGVMEELLRTFDTAAPDINFFTCTPVAVHKLAPRVKAQIDPVIVHIYKIMKQLGAENSLHYSWERIAEIEALAKDDSREKVRERANELAEWLRGKAVAKSEREWDWLRDLARLFEKGGGDALDKGSTFEANETLLDKRRTQHRSALEIQSEQRGL